MTRKIALTVIFSCLTQAALAAETLQLRPGLWEVTTTTKITGKNMPAEPDTDVDRECITEKEIKEASLFDEKQYSDMQCKKDVTAQTKSAIAMSVDCKGPKNTMKMTLDYRVPSPERMSGSIKSATTGGPLGPLNADLKMTGKWLSATCPNEDQEAEDEEESADASE